MEARFCWSHPLDELEGGHGAELAMGILVQMIDARFGREGVVRGVEFFHQPWGPAQAYETFFAVPVRFGCPVNGLLFHPKALDLANPGAHLERQLFLQPHLDRVHEQLGVPSEAGLLQRVREAIVDNAARGEFSTRELARRLGMSLRVLQRRLQEEGTNLSALLEEVRRVHARELLRDSRLSVDEVAFLIGYASERSFRRAFERWTGQSPAPVRRNFIGWHVF